MRARFDKLETNQIIQGAGLTQSSGREKVTVTRRVSDESQLAARAQYVHAEITSNAGRWLHEGYMTKPETAFYVIQGYFLVTQTKELIELELPFFLLVSLNAQL